MAAWWREGEHGTNSRRRALAIVGNDSVATAPAPREMFTARIGTEIVARRWTRS